MWPVRSPPLLSPPACLYSKPSLLLFETSSPRKTNKSPTCVPRSMLSRLLCLKPRISSLWPTKKRYSLLKDNASLSNTVRKLQRDVSKLEVFRRKLMQSLQEDDESSATGGPPIIAKPTLSEDDSALISRTTSMRSQYSDSGAEDRDSDVSASRPGLPHGLLLASQTSTPRLTPPGSPPSVSASVSPTRTSKPVSPRRHAVSFSTSRGMFDDRSSISSSDSGSQSGRTRVDGKEFFRQVRSRLSYEQFGAFLANVKELNSHKQTREETLRKAEEIFGPDNRDLYAIFEGLINRNVH
uniref:At4g15545-like C-terminal domain-containing protein n=1 Tax=Gossypium raimondii TaxID=29730 RepID=A0A0D2VNT7_GOSRA|nr:hypothetical protein B456_011G182600 [Gossypium raimondii]